MVTVQSYFTKLNSLYQKLNRVFVKLTNCLCFGYFGLVNVFEYQIYSLCYVCSQISIFITKFFFLILKLVEVLVLITKS